MGNKTRISFKKSFSSCVLFFILFFASLFTFRGMSHAFDVDVDANGSVLYFGSRKVFYMSTWQLYWVFYQDGNGNFAYDCFDKNSNELKQAVLITTTTVGGNVYGSIWGVETSSDV